MLRFSCYFIYERGAMRVRACERGEACLRVRRLDVNIGCYFFFLPPSGMG